MLPSDALRLIQRLAIAYPRHPLHVETVRLYLDEITRFDPQFATDAVDCAIATLKFFPTVAELRRLVAFAELRANAQRGL